MVSQRCLLASQTLEKMRRTRRRCQSQMSRHAKRCLAASPSSVSAVLVPAGSCGMRLLRPPGAGGRLRNAPAVVASPFHQCPAPGAQQAGGRKGLSGGRQELLALSLGSGLASQGLSSFQRAGPKNEQVTAHMARPVPCRRAGRAAPHGAGLCRL